MEKTKKSIFSKIFVCLSLCLVLLGALAPCFSMNKNQPLRADSITTYYDFNGSNFVMPCNIAYKDETTGGLTQMNTSFVNFQISFSVNTNDTIITSCQSAFVYMDSREGYVPSTPNPSFPPSEDFDSTPTQTFTISKDNGYNYFDLYVGHMYMYDHEGVKHPLRYYVDCMVLCNSKDFNSNIVKVAFGSSESLPLPDFPSWVGVYNYVKYIDNNNNFIVFAFKMFSAGTYPLEKYDRFTFDYREYYLSTNFNDNEYYNQGFDVGYSDGYNKGNIDGNKAGYDSGYNAGNTIGYNNGYNDGLNDGNQYTFVNLIGATIDAPIQYFKSLFNFELLGVNLSSFLMGLFTLCVIVTIVKLCLGR